MRLLSALAVAGCAFCLAAAPAGAAIVIDDFTITNAGSFTTACPVTVKFQAHAHATNATTATIAEKAAYKVAGPGSGGTAVAITFVGTTALVLTGSLPVTVVKASTPTARITRTASLTLDISALPLNMSLNQIDQVPVSASKKASFTLECPVILPGTLQQLAAPPATADSET